MYALCQICLGVSCLLYETHASEKTVQEILVYYLYMPRNVLLEVFCLAFLKIILHNYLPEFHKIIKYMDEKV